MSGAGRALLALAVLAVGCTSATLAPPDVSSGDSNARDGVDELRDVRVPDVSGAPDVGLPDGVGETGGPDSSEDAGTTPDATPDVPAPIPFPDPTEPGSWVLVGDALRDGETIVLTPDEKNRAGGAWYTTLLELEDDFDIRVVVTLGDKADGADGMAFVLAPEVRPAPSGKRLGFQGLRPSVAIELDTFQNAATTLGGDLGDPPSDHLALDVGGSPDHRGKGYPVVPVADLTDGAPHTLRVTWHAASQSLRAYLDTEVDPPTLEYVGDIVTLMDGARRVRFGLTAATGTFSNRQAFSPVSAEANPGVGGRCRWELLGSAERDGERVVLTPSVPHSLGAAWCDAPHDLAEDFDLRFRAHFGADPSGGAGIAFVLSTQAAPASPGGTLGYAGIAPSIAWEIDTEPNASLADPADVHVAIDVAGSEDHTGNPRAKALFGVLEDGEEHTLRFTWTGATGTLRAFVDEREVTYRADIVTDYLGGATSVRLGFVGATGAAPNYQYVVPVQM